MAIRNNARKHVRVLTGRDVAALKALGRLGVAIKQQLMTHCSLTAERLAKLCHSKYLAGTSQLVAGAGLVTVYRLASKGEDWLRDQDFTFIKHSHPLELNHDLKVSQFYFGLPAYWRDYWYPDKAAQQLLSLTNTAGRQNFPDAILVVPRAQVPNATQREDVAYYTVAIEAIGQSYSPKLIAAKREYAEQHFDQYLVC